MKDKKLVDLLKKQHYYVVGNHSAVQVCRWTKKDLLDQGECYKAKFYGIKSYGCAQMSPSAVFCQNMCLHCWRAIEHTEGNTMKNLKKIDDPKTIIEGVINGQRKLLSGFKGNSKVNLDKFNKAQNPSQFAISLIGEPTLYPKLGELISDLRKLGKTSFVVTNGLEPGFLKKLNKNSQLPTQLYLSLNSPNKTHFLSWHRSSVKNSWEKFNKTLELFPELKTRKVIRMTLAKGKQNNMLFNMIPEYSKLIKKSQTDFIEVKGYMSVGFARERIGYEDMPDYDEILSFTKKLVKELGKPYKILDFHIFSKVILIGKSKLSMKIKKDQI